MTLRRLQNIIRDELNVIEMLVQGGCKAFSEDDRTSYSESDQWVSGGKVSLVVMTPDAERSGSGEGEGIAVGTSIIVQCIEIPQIAATANVIRALTAAQKVAHVLDGGALEFRSIQQRGSRDRQGNIVVTATATFEANIILTEEDETSETNERN